MKIDIDFLELENLKLKRIKEKLNKMSAQELIEEAK